MPSAEMLQEIELLKQLRAVSGHPPVCAAVLAERSMAHVAANRRRRDAFRQDPAAWRRYLDECTRSRRRWMEKKKQDPAAMEKFRASRRRIYRAATIRRRLDQMGRTAEELRRGLALMAGATKEVAAC